MFNISQVNMSTVNPVWDQVASEALSLSEFYDMGLPTEQVPDLRGQARRTYWACIWWRSSRDNCCSSHDV